MIDETLAFCFPLLDSFQPEISTGIEFRVLNVPIACDFGSQSELIFSLLHHAKDCIRSREQSSLHSVEPGYFLLKARAHETAIKGIGRQRELPGNQLHVAEVQIVGATEL